MNRILIIVATVALPLLAISQNSPKKVAVWETKCTDKSITPFQSTMVRGGMETVVGNTAGYEVYDRSAFDAIMKEQKFQRTGAVSNSDIKRLGEMVGVQYIIVPEATVSGDEFYILVKMLDVETGRFGGVFEALCEPSGAEIKKACSQLGSQLFGSNTKRGELMLSEGRYVGETKDGKPHGKGILYYNDSSEKISYNGVWVKGKREGKGEMLFYNGDKYEGNFENDKANGQGTYYWANGDKYEGNFENDKANGQGTYYWANGDKYIGNYKDNNRSGYGRLYLNSGDLKGNWYEGNFENDKANGQGTYYWANGDKYVGDFKDNSLSGYGIKYFTSDKAIDGKNRYEGFWKDWNSHGKGVLYYNDGSKIESVWENGVLQGQSTYTSSDGSVVQYGMCVNGEMDGLWTTRTSDGSVLHATYSNGKLIRDWH